MYNTNKIIKIGNSANYFNNSIHQNIFDFSLKTYVNLTNSLSYMNLPKYE